jgi:hypothetical protein
MSLQSLSRVAVQRDAPALQSTAPSGAADEAPAAPQTWGEVIVAAIPSEVLAGYTAILGVIVASVETGGNNRFWMRWILYMAAIAVVVFWLAASYARNRTTGGRRFPWLETAAAAIAFGGWGLVMPGSPLSLSLGSNDLALWTTIILVVTALVVGALGVPLTGKVK